MKTPPLTTLLTFGLACFCGVDLVRAQTNRTWNGSSSTDWYDPNNWTPVGVPGPNDIVNVSLGAINLSSPVTINGQFNWSGSALTGSPLTITSNGVFNISGNSPQAIRDTVVNAGVTTWTGTGGLEVDSLAVSNWTGHIENVTGGLWDIQTDQALVSGFGVESFSNAGTLRKSVGTGTTTILLTMTNSGTLDAQTGAFSFPSNAVYFQGGATLSFGLSGPLSFGHVSFAGGVNFAGTLSVHLLNGYAPAVGDAFGLAAFAAALGSLASLDLPALNTNLAWQVSYSPIGLRLVVGAHTNSAFQISGTVATGSGAPVSNLTVFAYATNALAALYQSTTTDALGHYSLDAFNATWTVGLQGVTAAGFNSTPVQNAVVTNASQTVNFTLAPTIPPPANDQLAGAVALADGVLFTMDTSGATSLNKPLPTCQTNVGRSVWFSYQPTAAGPVTVSSCGSSIPTALQVYTGTATALTPVTGACNAGQGPDCPTNAQASVTFNSQTGTVYYVLIGGVSAAGGVINVRVFHTPAPAPPTVLHMGTFTLQVNNYDHVVWDPSSGTWIQASGYAQTTLVCDNTSYMCTVHFDNLTIGIYGLNPDEGVVLAGTASYPTVPPQGPVLAIPVAGFTLIFDDLTLYPAQAVAHIRLRFPPTVIDPTLCGPPEVPLGLQYITASAACELPPILLDTLAYGPWIVGDAGIVIQGIGMSVDFSTTWSPPYSPLLPPYWRGVVLGAGATVPAASGSITSNWGYVRGPYSYPQALVTATGVGAQFSLTAAYNFTTVQPLGYQVFLTDGALTLADNAVTGGQFRNGTIVLPQKAVRDLTADTAVTANYQTLTVENNMDLYGDVTVAEDFYFGELTESAPLRAFAVSRLPVQGGSALQNFRGSVYFSALLQPPYWPLGASGDFAEPNFPVSAGSLALERVQGLILSFPAEIFTAAARIFTPEKDPNYPNDRFDPDAPIIGNLGANSWIQIGAQGVHGRMTLFAPTNEFETELLGDTNSPYYQLHLAQTNFVTTLPLLINSPMISLDFVDSAVFRSDGSGSIYLGEPTKANLPVQNLAFTSTAHLPGASVELSQPARLDYWQVDLVQNPNASAAGVVSFKTGEVFLTGAGIQEPRHFAQPFYFLWGIIYANGNWDNNPMLDLNYEGQQFDTFNYAPEVFYLSTYVSGDKDGTNAFFQVGGPISFDFFGATYLNILDRYYKAITGPPNMGRHVELITTATPDIGLQASHLHLSRQWGGEDQLLQQPFGDFEFDIHYNDSTQDGFAGPGTVYLPALLGGTIQGSVTLYHQTICLSVFAGSVSVNWRPATGPLCGVTQLTGCGCIRNGSLQQLNLAGSVDSSFTAGPLLRAASDTSFEAILTPASTSFDLNGQMDLSLMLLADMQVTGEVKLVTNRDNESVDADVEGTIDAGALFGAGGSVKGTGKLNWHIGLNDGLWLQGLVGVKVLGALSGAGAEGGFFAGAGAPKDSLWVIQQEDSHYRISQWLPQTVTGVYAYVKTSGDASVVIASGGADAFVGLGVFLNPPQGLGISPVPFPGVFPYCVGHCGAHVWGKLLGGVVSVDGWGAATLGVVGGVPVLGHGSIELDACVFWVGCASMTVSFTLDSHGLNFN